jgi:hypothetical protein
VTVASDGYAGPRVRPPDKSISSTRSHGASRAVSARASGSMHAMLPRGRAAGNRDAIVGPVHTAIGDPADLDICAAVSEVRPVRHRLVRTHHRARRAGPRCRVARSVNPDG